MKIIFRIAGFLPMFIMFSCHQENNTVKSAPGHEFNGSYKGENLEHVAFPIGGIGSGMICLEGSGAISHVSVWNHPDILNEPAMFAALTVKGLENGARVLEGPVPERKIYGRLESGGETQGSTYGLPRFDQAQFTARFPFGRIELRDKDIPLDVSIEGWSPFIPLDADNSSLPCGSLEYTYTNRGNTVVEAVFSYHAVNFMRQPDGTNRIKELRNGFILSNEAPENEPHLQGDFAISTGDSSTIVDHCWASGDWFDPQTISWKHVAEANPRVVDPVDSGAPGASLYVPFKLKPGESKTIILRMAWYVPFSKLRSGEELFPMDSEEEHLLNECACNFYQPWYSYRFYDIEQLSEYWSSNYKGLKNRTLLFTGAFYNSTLPDAVTEAVAANLTILKSPTILRQFDGRLWAWEGCSDKEGCGPGSCTHVWNYAQAIPHLFPSLERSLRETEFFLNQNEEGHQTFRSALPLRMVNHGFHATADGQLGGIMKMFRDWRISGDDHWVIVMYPYMKQSLDYCIRTWDPRETGTLEEPHYNTYDVEFWGPEGMCTSFYLGALKAFSDIGEYLGDDVSYYRMLLERGTRKMEEDLFNGEYFIQEIMTEGLDAGSPAGASGTPVQTGYSDEAPKTLREEGSKYQYGTGCLSDGLLGMWMAKVCGIDDEIVDNKMVRSHLQSVYSYNFRSDLGDHANPHQSTIAMKQEAGLLLCTWPGGKALSLPFIYSNEVWTGIEYQVASHLAFYGRTEESLDIVEAVRQRYDGRKRNPFSEYEAGHWYARALASYGLFQGLTGVRYDAVTRTLYIDSRIGNHFTSFFSCQSGFGNVGLRSGNPVVKMEEGHLDIDHCFVSGKEIPLSRIRNESNNN